MRRILQLAILYTLLYIVFTQRGGGGGGGRGSSRSSSQRRRRIQQCKAKCNNQTNLSSQNLKECYQKCDPPFDWKTGGIFFGVLGIIATIGVIQQNKRKKAETQQMKLSLKQKIEKSTTFALNTDELKDLQKNVQGSLWMIEYQQTTNRYSTPPFKIICSDREKLEQGQLTKVQMSSSDSVGSWKSEGWIIYSNRGVAINMKKYYNNRKSAGQTGKWSNIFYQGSYNSEIKQFVGRWFFSGFEENYQYSGSFTMNTVKQQ